jgi:deoxyxylulose-5-phosphate synthase
MFEDCRTPPLLKPHETAVVDYVFTGHFLLVNAPCLNKIQSKNPLTVRLPNGATMESTHTATLDKPELNKAASIVHIFLGMENHSLLSVGKLCNEGYSVTFKIDTVTIYNPLGVHILKGAQDLDTDINLLKEHQQHPHEVSNKVYELRNTGALVDYLHKAMFSPIKSALLQAVKNSHLITWPGLTEQTINKHL